SPNLARRASEGWLLLATLRNRDAERSAQIGGDLRGGGGGQALREDDWLAACGRDVERAPFLGRGLGPRLTVHGRPGRPDEGGMWRCPVVPCDLTDTLPR